MKNGNFLFEFKESDPPEADQPPQYDLPDLRGRQEYIKYFDDLSASGGLEFEPVEAKRRSRSSGTQKLGR